jgi:hypothetical protein
MQIIKPTNEKIFISKSYIHVFLGGSIEMGKADDWQNKLCEEFINEKNIIFFNPRRDSWDNSWIQEEKNTVFNQQVNWELNHLDAADLIFMYLQPNAISPISLLEIGLYANSKKLIICCPDGFHRKGNVNIVCTRYNIPLYNSFEDAIGGLKTLINYKKTSLI